MHKAKKLPTIRLILVGMERDLEALRLRLGIAEVPMWDEKNRKEQNDELRSNWPEVIRLSRGLQYIQAKVGRIGRQKGDRTKLTPAMIRQIKANGRRRVSALARELGVSRQTIYTVLGKA